MAYVDHRCTACTHLRGAHLDRDGQPDVCQQTTACTCRAYVPGEPQVVRTFGFKGPVLDTYTPPGKQVAPGVVACGCPECRALYRELTEPETEAGAA